VTRLPPNLSQISLGRRCYCVDAPVEALTAGKGQESPFDIETVFRAQYGRIARVIAKVVRDPARAEELAVEVFLKLWRNRRAQGEKANGWLYRSAVRMGLDELRRQERRARYERLLGFGNRVRTPEQIRTTAEEGERVRLVLSSMKKRYAELLVLRSDGLSYEEAASALELNPASVGTLLIRAQEMFRKEYIKRYGQE
jgi:RNA polymerase sigma-70 factor, ECF subfamily